MAIHSALRLSGEPSFSHTVIFITFSGVTSARSSIVRSDANICWHCASIVSGNFPVAGSRPETPLVRKKLPQRLAEGTGFT